MTVSVMRRPSSAIVLLVEVLFTLSLLSSILLHYGVDVDVGVVSAVSPLSLPSSSFAAAAASILLLPPLAVVMAVDKSKFRTCEQTSFCRRHRYGKSRSLYDYKIVPESIILSRGVRHGGEGDDAAKSKTEGMNSETAAAAAASYCSSSTDAIISDASCDSGSAGITTAATVASGGGGGLRSKISRMLPKSIGILNREEKDLTSQHQQQQDHNGVLENNDPYVRGPSPFLTATLVNAAPFTSTALTARVYGNCNDGQSSDSSFVESLNLAVYLHEDGVARIRVTEVLEQKISDDKGGGGGNTRGGGGPRSAPRWTSDELVLNEKEMIGVNGDNVSVFYTNPMIPSRGDGSGGSNDNNIDNVQNSSTLSSLIDRANLGTGLPSNVDNFIVLSYGDEIDQFQLMLRLEPFAAFFFRGDGSGPPAIVAGTGGLTHFEVRRNKRACPTSDDGGIDEIGTVDDNRRERADLEVDIVGESTNVEVVEEVEEEDRHGGKEIVGYWEDGLAIYADGTREERRNIENDDAASNTGGDFDTKDMWEERFGDHVDSKPHGPMSVGMELTFPSSRHLFGLPEHASSTQLKTTKCVDGVRYYNEPYRLYNLDVFEYELDETMALYGHVPLIVSQSISTGTAGAFWFNPTETFVDIEDDPQVGGEDGVESSSTKAHFISESGIIDLFLLPGPDPAKLYAQYARLTGRMSLPPMFSLGYHQCRWNYRDEADVYQVHSKFEELDYPYDVLWLDIEHTDGKRYFTWDKKAFPNPEEMQRKLGSDGRRMVTIIDPHIKRDDNYYIHKEATALGLYIKDKKAEKDFDGWCWPGSSSYLDFTTEKVRRWWAEQFQYNKYVGSTPELFTWNDMNEPSVFNGPEVSMQKDLLNLNNCEHREWHNLYGMLFHRSTSEGLIKRNKGENVRPFVLSRAFFAGSQRYGAIWTGDNEAKWSHLAIAAPMLLSLNVGALSFVGADVGGFFGNTDAELMTRWMQAGAYQPFFRGHAHHDAKRREPWMFDDQTTNRLRRAAMARYALLPYWYTVFWQAGVTGMPVMRTMWMQYPRIPELYPIDDQYLIGSDLLVKPVISPGATSTEIIFPASDCWYDVNTLEPMKMAEENGKVIPVTVRGDIDTIPVYQRGGSIIARKLRLRRSSHLMTKDPYTLYIALGNDLKAEGSLYMDDETTFDHKKKQDFGVASFHSSLVDNIALQNTVFIGNSESTTIATDSKNRMVERIILMGVSAEPREVRVNSHTSPLDFQYDAESKVLVIRNPLVSALDQWTILIAP